MTITNNSAPKESGAVYFFEFNQQKIQKSILEEGNVFKPNEQVGLIRKFLISSIKYMSGELDTKQRVFFRYNQTKIVKISDTDSQIMEIPNEDAPPKEIQIFVFE